MSSYRIRAVTPLGTIESEPIDIGSGKNEMSWEELSNLVEAKSTYLMLVSKDGTQNYIKGEILANSIIQLVPENQV